MFQLNLEKIQQFTLDRDQALKEINEAQKKYEEFLEKFIVENSLVTDLKMDCENEAKVISIVSSTSDFLYLPSHKTVLESLSLGNIRQFLGEIAESKTISEVEYFQLSRGLISKFDLPESRYEQICSKAFSKNITNN